LYLPAGVGSVTEAFDIRQTRRGEPQRRCVVSARRASWSKTLRGPKLSIFHARVALSKRSEENDRRSRLHKTGRRLTSAGRLNIQTRASASAQGEVARVFRY
jgi:hypothetical protein